MLFWISVADFEEKSFVCAYLIDSQDKGSALEWVKSKHDSPDIFLWELDKNREKEVRSKFSVYFDKPLTQKEVVNIFGLTPVILKDNSIALADKSVY